jgi:hypothetical protein
VSTVVIVGQAIALHRQPRIDMTPEDERLALQEGPGLLWWEARALRMTMRRDLKADQPVSGVPELEELAETLGRAAGTAGEERRRLLAKVAHEDNLALLTVLIRGAEGAALTGQRADQALRLEAAQTLRAVRELLRVAAE